MFKVTYSTMNDTYTKSFTNRDEAERFCSLIRKLYKNQNPTVRRNV